MKRGVDDIYALYFFHVESYDTCASTWALGIAFR